MVHAACGCMATSPGSMENVLDVDTRPYKPRLPVTCLDETATQLLREARAGLPLASCRPARVDGAFAREVLDNLFLCCKPFTGQRQGESRPSTPGGIGLRRCNSWSTIAFPMPSAACSSWTTTLST